MSAAFAGRPTTASVAHEPRQGRARPTSSPPRYRKGGGGTRAESAAAGPWRRTVKARERARRDTREERSKKWYVN